METDGTQNEAWDSFYREDYEIEAESRMKNLMWAVSGNYSLDTRLDLSDFAKTKYVAMYDAVKQGAFARYYDKDMFGLYLLKKIYFGAEEKALTSLAQLAVEMASYPRIEPERPGVAEIRSHAFEYLLEHSFHRLTQTLPGKIKLVIMRGVLSGQWGCEARIREPLERVRRLEQAEDTMELIRGVDGLYNSLIDPHFETQKGTLEEVLAVKLEEMQEFPWQDFLQEEAGEELLRRYLEQLEQQVSSLEEQQEEKEQ